MTPSDRKALHTLLDGLINAGADVRIDGYFFKSRTSDAQVATALAAFDEWSIETLSDTSYPQSNFIGGGSSPEVHITHYGDDRRPDLTPYEFLAFLRGSDAYSPPNGPSEPVRSSVGLHWRAPAKKADAGW